MRLLAFDGRTGASGDMLLGALVAAGADPAVLSPVEDALPVRYDVSTTDRNGIAATAVAVRRTDGDATGEDAAAPNDGADDRSHEHADEQGHSHEHADDHGHDDGHSHDHGHDDGRSDDHGHSHDHDHGHDDGRSDDHGHSHDHGRSHDHDDRSGDGDRHAQGAGPHRSAAAVLDVVAGLELPESVAADARATFELLAAAEAAVHGAEPDRVRFHEVGEDDAIADVVGVCLLVDDLDPDRVVTTPVAAGGGSVDTSHGTFPVPAPATVELAGRASWSLRGGPVEAELLTPTGAALLAHLAEGVDALPPMRVRAAGYGAGRRSFDSHPNVLRALVGEGEGGLRREPVTVLETNLDDASPELLGDLQSSLVEAGALDVSTVPLTMKKSRPGHLVMVVVRPEDAERVARRLAVETGTLGVRERSGGHRFVADRRLETATVEADGTAHEVAVKVASTTDGALLDVSAEFDDAAAVARETGLPTREVLRRAEAAVRATLDD